MCQEHAVARLRPALGTLVAIEARARDTDSAIQAVAAGFEAIRGIEARLHPARPGSDLARLNRASAGQRLPVHASTVAMLELCRQLHVLSGGCFEPALPGRGSVMHWLPTGHRAVLVQRRAWVDLGGIAKGYAVDLAVAALRRTGATAGLVNAGGDLRAFGSGGWPVLLRIGATAPQAMELRNCALAASDPAFANRPGEHHGYYPGVRGSRGGRHRSPGAVAVIAPAAALADALTKIVMFVAPARSARILGRCGARAVGGNVHPGLT